MKKRIIIISIFAFLFLGLICISFYLYQKLTKWNYDGTAVVLSSSSDHVLIGTTDVSICLDCYGFGKYFLGDVRVGIVEQEKHFYGEPDDTKGMMTDYRYYRNKMGEEYFKRKKNRKKFQMEVSQARTFWDAESIPNTKMLYLVWAEWFGGERDMAHKVVANFHFKTVGGASFMIETLDYLIVPEVSTREEAIQVLQEDYAYLDL